MLKYVGCSRWGMVIAQKRAEAEGRPWFVLGTTGYIGDVVEFRRWRHVTRLALWPDGRIFVYKAEAGGRVRETADYP